MKIAFIGYKVQAKYLVGVSHDEDCELLEFLKGKGLDIEFVIWNDSTITWSRYDLIILKSPWDYHEQIDQFSTWLDHIHSLGIRMLNPIEIIKWNSNKRYLGEISASGLSVIPTLYLDQGEVLPTDKSLFEKFSTDKLVVKPCVSAGAKNTIVLDLINYEELRKNVDALLSKESFLVQPFLKEIINGEWSFLFFNGKYSHSVLKVPKQDDFRVQAYHGGSSIYNEAEEKYIRQAQRYVDSFAKGTLYARVDGLIINDELSLMEIELIEPYLFMNSDEERHENYYRALLELIF
jgi:glutathione synthase/RimK-type ligase-like ATP-grasp enzyme